MPIWTELRSRPPYPYLKLTYIVFNAFIIPLVILFKNNSGSEKEFCSKFYKVEPELYSVTSDKKPSGEFHNTSIKDIIDVLLQIF